MKQITQEELNHCLQQHQLWVDSCTAEGRRAVLKGTDLHFFNLRRANLRHAILVGTNLIRADLQGADLRGADLIGVHLQNTDLRAARFSTNIRDCSSFSYAKFTPEALPWLILHPKWAELKDTVRIEIE